MIKTIYTAYSVKTQAVLLTRCSGIYVFYKYICDNLVIIA